MNEQGNTGEHNLKHFLKGLRWCAIAFVDAVVNKNDKRAWADLDMAKEQFAKIQGKSEVR